MYPTITALLRDLFGINFPLPIQTFGFFMALSFAGAYITTTAELKRKEGQGLLPSRPRKFIRFKRVTPADYALNMLVGALIGFKLLEMALNYSELVANPQEFILSGRGSLAGALIGAGIAWYGRKKEDDKAKANKPTELIVQVPPHQLMGTILGIAALSGLLGAKIFHNLEYIGDFMKDPVGSLLSFSGLTFYGGLIVAAVAVLYYTGKNGIPAAHMIDATAPGLMLAYGVGRIGCHLSGDGDWGIVNTHPKPFSWLPDWTWSYNYPHNVVNEGIPLPGCDDRFCSVLPQGVYPTPLYEAIICILLFMLLWSMRRRITIPGMLSAIYLVLNGVERFLVEKIRVNSTYDIFGMHITQAELISAAMVLTGVAAMLYLRQKPKAPQTSV